MAQLNALDPREVLQKIVLLADGAEAAALLCYESPNDPMQWCHRGQVAGLLHDKLKIAANTVSRAAAAVGRIQSCLRSCALTEILLTVIDLLTQFTKA
jgi:hypothetical protein